MPRTIKADGRTITVPDDATPEEVNQIVGPAPRKVAGADGPLPGVPGAHPDLKPLSVADSVFNRDRESDYKNPVGTQIQKFGNGFFRTGINAVTHPIDTAKSIAQTTGEGIVAGGMSPGGMYPTTAPTLNPGRDALNQKVQLDAQQHQSEMAQDMLKHPADSAGGAASLALLSHGLTKGAGAIGDAAAPGLRSAGGALNDALIGTPAEGLHGATPGLEMAKQGIVGSTPSALTSSLRERIPAAVAEHRGIVSAAPQDTKINTGPLISPPFKSEISAGTNPRTGAASPAQIGIASRTMRQLTHVPDSETGQVTPMMRDPNLSPLEATDLKSNIYDRTNYDPSGRFNIANAGLKGAAHALKSAVETAVPESIPSGHTLHNLVQAKEILDPAARGQMGIPTSKSGLIDRAVLGTGTRAASGLYGAGDAAATLSQMPSPAPVAALMQSLRKKNIDEDQQ